VNARMLLALVLALVLVPAVAGCGADEEDPAAPAAEPWPGPPQPDEDGNVPVDEFNAYVEEHDPDWARTPLLAAAAFYGERERMPGEGGEVTLVAERPEAEDERTVVVTEDELPDDSVRAVRYTLRFERADEETWRLAEAQWAQRCQPDRGQQDFAPEPCV
jgi:hypothetical protein